MAIDLNNIDLKIIKFANLFLEGKSKEFIRDSLNLSNREYFSLYKKLGINLIKDYEDLPDEEWKQLGCIDAPTFFISNKGRLRNHLRLIHLQEDKDGYYYTVINDKYYRIHRLVMYGFYGIEREMQVNHLDYNKKNNNLNNLEYCTSKENTLHSHLRKELKGMYRYRIQGTKNPSNKLTEDEVRDIFLDKKSSNSDLARKYKVNDEQIRRIRAGLRWGHFTSKL